MPTILTASGSAELQSYLATTLAAAGFRVHELGASLTERPHLVVVGWPGLSDSGADMLRTDPQLSGLPVVLVTDSPERDAPAGLQPQGWLIAPIAEGELAGCVKGVLRAAAPQTDTLALRAQVEQLEQRCAELEDADRKKDEFISFMSHELKNPMASIKGYADLIRRRVNKNPDDPNRKGLDIISQQIGRMTGLLDQLLDFSRISMDRVKLERRPTSLASLVGSVADAVQANTTRHTLTVSVDGSSPIVEMDEPRMFQVLQAVMENAVKFSPDGGAVEVRVAHEGDPKAGQAIVEVRDYGLGMSEEDRAQVFERFFRGANTSESTKGLGLGLFIAHELVSRHEGQITAHSPEGGGALFRIVLPAAQW